MKQISCFQELLILFWKLIDENKEVSRIYVCMYHIYIYIYILHTYVYI